MPRNMSTDPEFGPKRTSRRSVLQLALAAAAGVTSVAALGAGPLGRLSGASAEEASTGRRCSSCWRSVETRAGYVKCDSCGEASCPRCISISGDGFVCSRCDA